MSVTLDIKRTAATAAWTGFISYATGQLPVVNVTGTGVDIAWRPGQSSKMADYFIETISSKPTAAPGTPKAESLNVHVNMAPVIATVLIKKYWYVAAGTGLFFYLIGKYT